jgi:hypothetical protein
MTTIPEPSALDQLYLDLFTTALEGGINYWSECAKYSWAWPSVVDTYPDGRLVHENHKGFHAIIIETEEKENIIWPEQPITPEDLLVQPGVFRIDRSVIAKGYRLATTEWRSKLNWSTAKPPLVVGPDTDWDFDAGDADMIVQLGLLGEVRYG